jgi:anti-sigma factor RsiW
MNHIPDTELALYAGNDLEPSEHLRECAECRVRLEEFQAAREWLKNAAVAPAEAQVHALESAVLRAIAPQHRFRWWMAAAAAVAAVLLVFGGIRYFSPESPPVSVPAIAMAELPRLEHAPIELKLPRTVHHLRPEQRAEAMTIVSENNGSPVVRLKTSDPNVIVLWVLNTPPKEGNIHE